MDARLNILRSLIERLEPMVGEIARPGNFSWWGEGSQEAIDRSRRGDGHFVQALNMARKALASGSAHDVELAALYAPTYERTGLAMRAAYEAKIKRKSGGLKRGEALRGDAGLLWKPYTELFGSLLAAGQNEKKARHAVVKKMECDEFTIPSTGGFPSNKTIKKWLSSENVEGR